MSAKERCLFQICVMAIMMNYVEPGNAETTDDIPSVEFLEFIGEWQLAEGQFIDPLMLNDSKFNGDKNESSQFTYSKEEYSDG